jgi:hypothetical protein
MTDIDTQIVVTLYEYFSTDDEPARRKGYSLRRKYEDASETEKEIIDDLMITICGYSLKTIIEEAKSECSVWIVVNSDGEKIGEFVDEDDAEEFVNNRIDEECSIQKGISGEW